MKNKITQGAGEKFPPTRRKKNCSRKGERRGYVLNLFQNTIQKLTQNPKPFLSK